MTIKQLIESTKRWLDNFEDFNDPHWECGEVRQHKEEVEKEKLILEISEKQIPKKPVLKKHENRVPGEQDEYYCPNCDEWITWDWKWKWCAFCGQAIDWSEVEE